MAAIIGDAKIKVTLDTDAARRMVERIPTGGKTTSKSPSDGPQDGGVDWHSIDESDPAKEKKPGKRIYQTQSEKEALLNDLANLASMKNVFMAAVAAYVSKQVIDGIESSPKFVSMINGVVGMKGDISLVNYLSDEITKIKTTIGAYFSTPGDMKDISRAALRLGQHMTVGGAQDLWSFLLNVNQRQDLMKERVDKEIDKEILQKFGESVRLAVSR